MNFNFPVKTILYSTVRQVNLGHVVLVKIHGRWYTRNYTYESGYVFGEKFGNVVNVHVYQRRGTLSPHREVGLKSLVPRIEGILVNPLTLLVGLLKGKRMILKVLFSD